MTTGSRTRKSEIGGQAAGNHDGPSITDPLVTFCSGITIFDVFNPGPDFFCANVHVSRSGICKRQARDPLSIAPRTFLRRVSLDSVRGSTTAIRFFDRFAK